MSSIILITGFLVLFLLYQIAEANGQDLLKIPGKPYSIFILYLLVIPVADLIARWQNAPGLASYGMGLHYGWWQNYLLGVGLGIMMQVILESVGVQLGIRQVANFRFSLGTLMVSTLWILFANFPAAASEDLITRGYLLRFMQQSPLLIFMICSALIYTLNHIIRLLTRPISDWYHLPFTGLMLAYAFFQTRSMWYVIGLHQSGNVVYYLMQQMMQISNTEDTRKRILYGIFSESIFLLVVILATPIAIKNHVLLR